MDRYPSADERLAGRRSLQLLFQLLAITLVAAFFGTLLVAHGVDALVPHALYPSRHAATEALLIALLVGAIALPFMLYLRRLHLRQQRKALRLQYTLDHHAIVSITDAAGRITYANDRFCEISGYTREELLGQNHRILKSGLHSPEFYKEIWTTAAAGRVWHGDICNRAKNGQTYWVHATIVPFLNARGKPEEYIAIRTEISRQKTLELESRQQEARLRTILDNLGEGVYMLDAAGSLRYLNHEAERLLGWSFDDLAGKALHDLIHYRHADGRPMPPSECVIQRTMAEGKAFRSNDEMFFRKDGSPLPVKVAAAPLVVEGRQLGWVAVFSDASEERLLQQRLFDAKDAAEAAARLKSEFLSTMSHEIRTPLNGVIGMTDLLLETTLDAEQTEFAHLIKTSADALMAIVSDILDFSKIEAGRLELETTHLSLRQTVESTLDVLAGKAFEKSLLVGSFVAPELPDHLLGDPTRLRQILLNFLSNAVKFTASGQVMVNVLAGKADHDSGTVSIRFEVTDTGIGVSQADAANLFQPFVQTDSSTTRRFGGTGLGLSICKRLVEAMGGQIGVDSRPGRGATFWAEVALAVAEEKRAVPVPAEMLRGRRLVIAGSDSGSAALWRRYLSAWRVDCESAVDFAELERRVAVADAAGTPYDTVLLASPLGDATAAEAAMALRAKGCKASLLCCLPQPDRPTKAMLADLDAVSLQGPMRQSTLLGALAGTHRPAPEHPTRRAADNDEPPGKHPRRGGRLLLAEDNAANRQVAQRMLKRLGYEVDVVANGLEAVAAASGGNHDLVLMDCQMPEMDGFDATAAIRRGEAGGGRHMTIVAMTANALPGDRERCIAAGMDDYLPKPIEFGRLGEMLAKWLPEAMSLPPPVAELHVSGVGDTPAVDLKRIEQIFDGDEEGMEELFRALGETLAGLVERLRRELADKGFVSQRAAHELRGLAGNVGASRLARLACQLEEAVVAEDHETVVALAPQVMRECLHVNDFIMRRGQRQQA